MKFFSALLPAFLLLVTVSSCKDQPNLETSQSAPDTILHPKDTVSKNPETPDYHPEIALKALDAYISRISKLMNKPESLLRHYYKKILRDTCFLIINPDSSGMHAYVEDWEPGKDLSYINQNKIRDLVYVIDAMNLCDEGEAYIFSDTTLPPLITNSYCCHPDSMFTIGDIDRDGTQEICIWLSSCGSRYKRLVAYSLKGGKWEEVGTARWDTYADTPAKEKRVRPVSKGKFRMLTRTCEYNGGKPYISDHWETFTIPSF